MQPATRRVRTAAVEKVLTCVTSVQRDMNSLKKRGLVKVGGMLCGRGELGKGRGREREREREGRSKEERERERDSLVPRPLPVFQCFTSACNIEKSGQGLGTRLGKRGIWLLNFFLVIEQHRTLYMYNVATIFNYSLYMYMHVLHVHLHVYCCRH